MYFNMEVYLCSIIDLTKYFGFYSESGRKVYFRNWERNEVDERIKGKYGKMGERRNGQKEESKTGKME